VRNLSGAIISLKKSLKFNKYNIDARNLLGLVYYEMGEVVDALSEWVISKSYQEDDNIAGRYLEAIRENRAQLEAINQTIKKYNQALLYCKQDSRDMAIIQLKKVLSLNPKLVKGHQLLALLYLQEDKLEQAKKELRNAGKIDADNTITLRYLKEVNTRLREKGGSRKKKEDDLLCSRSSNFASCCTRCVC
jgi:tetratricopeptide (TPR) repeat protein